MNIKTRCFILCCLVLVIAKSHGQQKIDSLKKVWNTPTLGVETRANALNRAIVAHTFKGQIDSAYKLNKQLEIFVDTHQLIPQRADLLINYGNIDIELGNFSSATENYLAAMKLYQERNERKGEAVALNGLARIYNTQWNFNKAKEYFEQSLKICEELKDTVLMSTNLINIGNVYNNKFESEKAIEYYLASLRLDSIKNDQAKIGATYLNMGDAYGKLKEYEKANQYLLKGLEIGKKSNSQNVVSNAYHMLTATYLNKKAYKKAQYYGEKGLRLAHKMNSKRLINYFNLLLFRVAKETGNNKAALDYLEASNSAEDKIAEITMNQNLQKFEIERVRMKDSILSAEKEKQKAREYDLEIQKQNAEKKQLIVGFAIGMIVLIVIGSLLYSNSKRKQKLAEKEKEIQLKENDRLLKESELNTINAMIRGQEKEREKLAKDLHDSIGSILSAAKLQFNHLAMHKSQIHEMDELFTKTSTLLDDAYQGVRNMAHLKNSGVLAKEGLLPALEKLAASATTYKGLSISVHSFGLESRISNSIEIEIFRILQELVTNIIKHSQATEASISLTQNKEELSIIVEDNGIGFNHDIIDHASGMGLGSIKKRIDIINGSMKIDTAKDKGTTILIDIKL